MIDQEGAIRTILLRLGVPASDISTELLTIIANLGTPIMVVGTITTSTSASAVIDTSKIGATQKMVGSYFIPFTGAAALDISIINTFNGGTGGYTFRQPLSASPGTVGYVILQRQDTSNTLPVKIPHPGVYTASVAIPGGAGASQALGTLTIAGIPTNAVVAHLFVHFLFADRVDSSAATNALNGAQNLQVKKNAGGYSTFFAFAGGEYSTVASSSGAGDAKAGTVDLVALAPVNGDVLTFQWTTAKATGSSLTLNEFEIVVDLEVTL